MQLVFTSQNEKLYRWMNPAVQHLSFNAIVVSGKAYLDDVTTCCVWRVYTCYRGWIDMTWIAPLSSAHPQCLFLTLLILINVRERDRLEDIHHKCGATQLHSWQWVVRLYWRIDWSLQSLASRLFRRSILSEEEFNGPDIQEGRPTAVYVLCWNIY